MWYQVWVAKVNSLMFLIYQIEKVAVNNILSAPAIVPASSANILTQIGFFPLFFFRKLSQTAYRLGRHFTYKALQTLFNLYTKCHCKVFPWH